jgi:hypothetical protein
MGWARAATFSASAAATLAAATAAARSAPTTRADTAAAAPTARSASGDRQPPFHPRLALSALSVRSRPSNRGSDLLLKRE